MSILIKKQVKFFEKEINGDILVVSICHDDQCGNGHNTFSITGELFDRSFIPHEEYKTNAAGRRRYMGACGCLHDEISKHFPEIVPALKYHLCSTDGPMYYFENSLYWAGKRGFCNGEPGDPPHLENFRSTAIWPDAPDSIFAWTEGEITKALADRLPALMIDFQRTVQSFGFDY